jgi:hypothetical protein
MEKRANTPTKQATTIDVSGMLCEGNKTMCEKCSHRDIREAYDAVFKLNSRMSRLVSLLGLASEKDPDTMMVNIKLLDAYMAELHKVAWKKNEKRAGKGATT